MKLFKIAMRDGKKSANWYGKVKVAPKTWQKVTLFTDKLASERRLMELQKQADQRAAGMQTADTDRLALPVKELVKQYIQSLRSRNMDEDHINITERSLNKVVDAGAWQRFVDITAASMESILPGIAKTAGYQNAFIKKVKAFVHWALPDNWPDPLKKLKRVRERGAKKTRERRAATVEDAAAFFAVWPTLPADRHLSYALAMLNGLRRNEIKRNSTKYLRWGQLHLDAPLPFMALDQKMGDGQDHIPLHPYVVKLLRQRMAAMPTAPVVSAVPDIKTMKKDLARAKIELTDAQGLRLDFHALRHSFQTALDRTGCSRATKKKLMRHANEDVTDGYAHAELAEMLAALMRIPSPQLLPQQVTKTGTDDAPLRLSKADGRADHRLDHGRTVVGQSPAPAGMFGNTTVNACQNGGSCYNPAADMDLQALAMSDVQNDAQVVVGQELRPDTQVD